MKIRAAYAVCRGDEKTVCDDAALLGKRVVSDADGTMEMACGTIEVETPAILALCDGVGGNLGGRDASRFVCNQLAQIALPLSCEELRTNLERMNAELLSYSASTEDRRQMATTMTGLAFCGDSVLMMHAGNTRIYSVRGGYLQQLTEDHTTYRWLQRTGQWEAAEACQKSEIRCAFGGGNAAFLHLLQVEPLTGRQIPKRLLLTTDGVHDTVPDDRLEELLAETASDEEKVKHIVEEALQMDSDDDRSAVLLTVLEDAT